MLLVSTMMSRCFSSARATASVLVPMLRKDRAAVRDVLRAARRDRGLGGIVQPAAILVADVGHGRGQQRAAVHALQLAAVGQFGQIAADGLRRDVEMRGQFIDADPPVAPGDGQDLGQADVL
jgi:hypothetical protein